MVTYNTFPSIFNDPFFIGFDRLVNRVSTINTNSNGFPPYNVVKEDAETWTVEMAVAGFSKDEIEITEQDGTLKIEGSKEDESTADYLHRGIATRKFTRSFALGEYMYVDKAELTDGMLYITIKLELPEEKKPKTIKIK
jgi:molecular chaperone IbpA